MGIRLYCPNGHKVHVKAFLAGKRGICPHCGAKFDIPADPNVAAGDTTGDEIAVIPSAVGEPSQSAMMASMPDSPKASEPVATDAPTSLHTSGRSGLPTLDLDALAAAGGTSLLGGQAFGAAGHRLAARRKSAQTMRIVSVVLAGAVTILACVLIYILLRSR